MEENIGQIKSRTSRNNRYLSFGIFLGFAITIIAVWVSSKMLPPRDLQDKTIRIGYSPYILNLPIFVAKERDLFGDRPVEMKKFQTTDSMVTALIRGDIDIASAVGTERLILMNQNEHDVIIAKSILFNAFCTKAWTEAILVSSDRKDIKSIKDLDGKSIGTLPAATAVAYCRLIAETHNIKFSSIQQIKPTGALPTLVAGRIDALLAIEPQIAFSRQMEQIRILEEAPIAKSLQDPLLIGAHCVRQKRIESEHEFGPLCYKALSDATAYIKGHRLEALALAVEYVNMPETVLQKTQLPDWIPSGNVKPTDLEYIIQTFAKEGILQEFELSNEIIYAPGN